MATAEAGADQSYKDAIVSAGAGETETTEEFGVCALYATSSRARVLRAWIYSLHGATEPVAGTAVYGCSTVDVERARVARRVRLRRGGWTRWRRMPARAWRRSRALSLSPLSSRSSGPSSSRSRPDGPCAGRLTQSAGR